MAADPAPPPAAGPSPSPRSLGALEALLLAVLLLQVWTWVQLSGYQLADSIEYLERAETVHRGLPLDPGTLRSFAFSALLLPVFWLESLLPFDLPSLPVVLARLGQIGCGLWAARLLGRRLSERFGEGPALAGVALLCLNPIFLRWSVEPLSAAAGLASIALALAIVDRACAAGRARARDGLALGAALGAAVLLAYQNLLIGGLLGAALPLLSAWRRLRVLGAALLSFAALLLLQCLLDGWTYGRFGSSFLTYVQSNFAPQLATLLVKAGFDQAGRDVYAWAFSTPSPGAEMRTATSRLWYLENLSAQGLPLASLALLGLGAVALLAKRSGLALTLLAVFALNVLIMSTKGSKSFRLWMPLLPLIAWFGASGWSWLTQGPLRRWPGQRAALGLIGLALLAGQAIQQIETANLSKFGSYWQAIGAVERGSAEAPRRIASAYNWAVRYQNPPGTLLVKLPHHLDRWAKLDPEQQAETLAALETLDGFVGHLQSFAQDARLMEVVARRFKIASVHHDYEHAEELEPVYRLERARGEPGEQRFYEVWTDTGPGEPHEVSRVQAALQHPGSVDFRRIEDGRVYQMVLLGYDVSPGWLDGTQAFVTYTWYAGPLEGKDYHVIDRFTDGRGGVWQNNHRPCYGAWPTSRWMTGSIVRESYLTRLPAQAAEFGGPYRRGDLLPVRLWMAIAEYDAQLQVVGGLNPFRASGSAPQSRRPWLPGTVHDGAKVSEEGRLWSAEALSQVGGFFLPVARAWRVPDDGRVLPEPSGLP